MRRRLPYARSVAAILAVGDEVAAALSSGTPVVALESTIFSQLGLPEPANRRCFQSVEAAVRAAGAVPALCGVLEGRAVVGADDDQAERLFGGSAKLGARDLGPALAAGLDVGVTTVSATVTLAQAAGIEVFATGGIGGVHRGADRSGDVSHDLDAMARHRVIVVSAGVKAFLDVSLTFERLETLGVAVLGWRTEMRLSTEAITNVPTPEKTMATNTPIACLPSCERPPATGVKHNTPVSSAPRMPPTPCTPNASSESSYLNRVLSCTARVADHRGHRAEQQRRARA